MNPQIRYCTTTDNVRIAYWAMGSGPPLLHCPPMPFSDIAAELNLDDARAWYERMAETHTLIRYDPRAVGSSDRDVQEVSLEGFVLDVEAVATAMGFESYAIVASRMWVAPAITFAAKFPARVSHLILWNGHARPSDLQRSGRLLALRSVMDKDWAAYTDAWAQSTFGWTNVSQARAWSRVFRASTTAEDTLRRMPVLQDTDVSPLLPQIDAAALVVDYRKPSHVAQNAGPYLAANIRNSRLVVLDGVPTVPALEPERISENARLIDEFTGVFVETKRRGLEPSGTAVILFADIVDSTALTERMGDAAFRDRARTLDTLMRKLIADAGGAVIDAKTLGDGVLATFPAASQAIAAALACATVGDEQSLPLHLGLHAGDVIREQNNVFGGAVNIAARISALSAPGEVLVSDIVRGLGRTSAGVTFEDRGEHDLKGIGEAQRIYAVRPNT